MANCVTYVSGNATIISDGERREEAVKVLAKVKEQREGKKFILVPIGNKAFKEVEVTPTEKKKSKKTLKHTK